MSPITTHVLDTARGKPAHGISITLSQRDGNAWRALGTGVTDADGRCKTLLEPGSLRAGIYQISFALEAYYRASGTESFYPEASIVFEVRDPGQHYHVPLLLSPFGYSTYRGS